MRIFDDFDLATIKSLAPFMAVSALVSALLVLGVLQVSGNRGPTTVTVAVFDVVKFANAQRALASTFVGKKAEDVTEAGTLLLSLSKKTTAVIEKIAGAGTLVLVKQGVVSGAQLDITDAVLAELGLPTDVPTVGPMAYIQDVAPTMLFAPRRDPSGGPATEAVKPDAKVLP